MPNRGAIRAWARTQTLLESDDIADADVNSIINQGLRKVSTQFPWPWLATSSTQALSDGVQSYALPADLDRLEKVIYVGKSIPLEEVSALEAWHRKGDQFASGDPSHFFIWGESLLLSPIPTATSGSIKLYYYQSPTAFTDDTDVPPFAEQFHLVLADFTIARLWEREEDFSKAQEAEVAFINGVNDMARYYLNRATDHPTVFGGGLSQSRQNGFYRRPPFDWLDAP